MRTRFLLILSFASLSAAMPLRKGASWTWRVVDLKTNQTTHRTALVTDSARLEDPLASGTQWTLAIRDSSTGDTDTAQLLANGASQIWRSGSRLLPIEPKPWNGSDASWGMVALASLRDQAVATDYRVTSASISGTSRCGMYMASSTIDRPRGIWSDSLGVERFLLQHREWTLVRTNDRSVSLPDAKLTVPDSGSQFEWQRLVSTATFPPMAVTITPSWRIRWTITSRTLDSAGWKVVGIQETRIDNGAETTEAIRLALNPSTKERIPARLDSSFLPDDAWRKDWSDSVQGGLRLRASSSSSTISGTVNPTSSNTSTFKILDDALDSSSLSSSYSSKLVNPSSSSFSYVLLSIGATSIRAPTLGAKHPVLRDASNRLELSDISRSNPDATVRWSDLRGRSGTTTLERLLSSRPAAGVLHLSVRLPDGSIWQGTSLGLGRP